MDSPLAYSQFESFFSTAELSPPISPAPSSPSLYSYGGVSPNAAQSGKDVFKTTGNDFLDGGKPELVSNLLLDLQHFESSQYKSDDDLGINWNEESVNLQLFSELSDLDYVPPATPSSQEFTNQNSILQQHEFFNTIFPIPTSLMPEQPQISSKDYSQLSAEFQAILESLPGNEASVNTDAFQDIIAISGISDQYPEAQSISNFSAEQTDTSNDSSVFMDVDLASEDYSDIICLDDINTNSSGGNIYYSSPSIVTDVSATVFTDQALEENSDAAERILDALLLGNLTEAQTYLPGIQNLPEDNTLTFCAVQAVTASPSTNNIKKQRPIKPKPENKRSKDTEGRRRGRGEIVDKRIRKKEQNKTAATRYRQKKKLEAVVTTEVEKTMQQENDVLQAQANDLAKQISIVKQLVRDIMDAKKVTRSGSIRGRLY